MRNRQFVNTASFEYNASQERISKPQVSRSAYQELPLLLMLLFALLWPNGGGKAGFAPRSHAIMIVRLGILALPGVGHALRGKVPVVARCCWMLPVVACVHSCRNCFSTFVCMPERQEGKKGKVCAFVKLGRS